MQEVDALARRHGDKRSPRVDLRFRGSPVVSLGPSVDDRLQKCLLGAVIPTTIW